MFEWPLLYPHATYSKYFTSVLAFHPVNAIINFQKVLLKSPPSTILSSAEVSFVLHLEKQTFQKVIPFCSSVSQAIRIFRQSPCHYFIFACCSTYYELLAIFLNFMQPGEKIFLSDSILNAVEAFFHIIPVISLPSFGMSTGYKHHSVFSSVFM